MLVLLLRSISLCALLCPIMINHLLSVIVRSFLHRLLFFAKSGRVFIIDHKVNFWRLVNFNLFPWLKPGNPNLLYKFSYTVCLRIGTGCVKQAS